MPTVTSPACEERRLVRRLGVLARGRRAPGRACPGSSSSGASRSAPASPMWLLASDTQSRPASTSPSMCAGLAVNRGARCRGSANRLGAGFSKLAMARSAPEIRSRTMPALPVLLRVRQVPAHRRAVLAAAGDLDRAAVEREVRAAPGVLDRERHAAVQEDVAARDERPGVGRVVGGGLGAQEARRQRPLRQALDPVRAEQALAAPGERAHGRADVVGAQERRRGCGSSPGSPRARPRSRR